MKNFLLLILFAVLLACSEKTQETQSEAYDIPELLIRDSLVIDHLTKLYLIDVKSDRSEYLFFDFKSKDFLRVNKDGEVVFKANRSGDGPNSYKETYFYTADYLDSDKILLLTYNFAFYYDLEFNLLEKRKLDFALDTRNVGGSRAAEVLENQFYTFSIEVSDIDDVYRGEEFNIAYPFLTFRDQHSLAKTADASIPEESQIRKSPANYVNKDPLVLENGEGLWVLFPNSPELYVFNRDSLSLKRTFSLEPNDTYKQILPPNPEIDFDGFLKELAASQYLSFAFSNDYLLTMYSGAAPQAEVDRLPKEYLGGPEFTDLADKYKTISYYQIFKEEKKLWEGTWDVRLSSIRNLIYSDAKPGEDPDAVEKDVQTIYFYELK
ncbi:hypothetical protein SAMN04489724_2502 [Algoriphagus locisalis]|uniref:6-bladed beta-propeller protein n=1 Tax=Algoriphagus locisalis TaxID=305507 RepID=A0A1I7BKP8_9BACT|nr:hypothetical protein [Algoriphagus locisalis]SFT87760.1 hypothetical protein SAMN04489724_2502 [Algoriphagus locisalis]